MAPPLRFNQIIDSGGLKMKNKYWPKENWRTLGPEGPDMDAQTIAGLNQILDSRHWNLCGLVIVHHGYLAYEHYYNGYGPDDTVHVASVTKSILSALIARETHE